MSVSQCPAARIAHCRWRSSPMERLHIPTHNISTRQMAFSGHIVDMEGLPDELREKILSNFTLNELVAFEAVSKRWQRNVSGVLKEIKVLEVMIRGYYRTYSDLICEHSFAKSSTIRCNPQDHERVIRLIDKMHNLVALTLPSTIRTDGLMAALEKCPKFEHLAFSRTGSLVEWSVETTKISNALRPRLSCASGIICRDAFKEMTTMKALHYHCTVFSFIPLDLLTTALNNGVIHLKTTCIYEHFETVCKLGSRLESLDVNFVSGVTVRLSSSDVRQIVGDLPRLKMLRIRVSMTSLEMLKGLKNLEHLAIFEVANNETHLFKKAMAHFGHRLKSLHFNHLRDESVITDVTDVCPNLESFGIDNDSTRRKSKAILMADLRKLSKLRVIRRYEFYHWTCEEMAILLLGLPNLRKVQGFLMTTTVQLNNLRTLIKQKLPKLDTDTFPFIDAPPEIVFRV